MNKYIKGLVVLWILIIGLFSKLFAQEEAEILPNDSTFEAIQQIKAQAEVNRLKDSIRLVVLREELSKSSKDDITELEKYKKELLAIKQADSLRHFQMAQRIDSLRLLVTPAFVSLYTDTLFTIYTSIGPFDAQHRAQTSTDIIYKIYKEGVFLEDSITIEKSSQHLNIKYGNEIITSLAQDDAIWAKVPIDTLAQTYKLTIIDAINKNRVSHSLENSLYRWSKVVGIVLVFYLFLKLINWFFQRLIQYLILRNRRLKTGIKIRNYELISPMLLRRQFIQIVRLIKWALIILGVYFSLSLIFSIFPLTKNWAYLLLNWALDPLKELWYGLINFLPSLVKIIIILFIARFIVRMLRYFSYEIQRNILKINGFHRDWANPTYKLLRFLIYVFAFIVIFPMLPFADTAEFKGVTVFLGVLLSLGSTSTISNTIAGFIITYMRPFKVGDWIKINEIIGEVVEKTALVTRLRTLNNEDITVPNSYIMTNHTINYSSGNPEHRLCLSINLEVSQEYESSIVQSLLLQAAKETEHIISLPPSYVLQLLIKDNSIQYQLNAYTDQPDRMFFTKSDLVKNIQSIFLKNNVSLKVAELYSINK